MEQEDRGLATCNLPAYLLDFTTPEMLKALRSPAGDPFTLFNAGFLWGAFSPGSALALEEFLRGTGR